MSVPSDDTGWSSMPNWLLRDRSYTTYDKMLYLLLSSRLSPHGIEAWPSQNLIAEEMGVSTNTVQRALTRLRRDGIVDVRVVKTPTGRRNVYYINVHPREGRRPEGGHPSQR